MNSITLESRTLKKHKMFWSLKYRPIMLNPITMILFYYFNNGFFLKYQEVEWTMAVAAYCEGGIHCICEKNANNSNKILQKDNQMEWDEKGVFFPWEKELYIYIYIYYSTSYLISYHSPILPKLYFASTRRVKWYKFAALKVCKF